MEAMADSDDRRPAFDSSPSTSWDHSPQVYPHSYHGTPAQEYSSFNWNSPPLPMGRSGFASAMQHRPSHPQLQPLVMPMPQWPSMLGNQAHSTYQPGFPQPVQPIQPMSLGQLPTPLTATPHSAATPISASSTRSTATPRKTLTDADRKRMCQYAEDHPNSKQTEIGGIFGVERSTVSKVLRQKEKYLTQDDGSRSPIKRAKGRSPDLERTLANWAKTQAKKGIPLDDDVLRDKARIFAATTTNPDNHYTLTASWIEKFKLNHNLMGARSRKGSLAPDDADGISAAASSSQTPSGTSPGSPRGFKSSSPQESHELHSAPSQESLMIESPDSYNDFSSRHGPFHSQSTTSLNSAFTDMAPSSFSPNPLSPGSSFFTSPDSGTAPGPFAPPLTARPIFPASTANNAQRPRSQTFPTLDYMSVTGSADIATPKYITAAVLDSPMEEASDPLLTINATGAGSQLEERNQTVSPADMMRPPPLPAHVFTPEVKREPATLTSFQPASVNIDEAQRALEVVIAFINRQPHGLVDNEELIRMGSLLTKLKLQSRTGS